ncbi:MAG: ATP-dependent DNA ligase [Opitutus sp.]|nr:ATP-dependent DNA ligase [Opitutus sp.]
MKRTSSTLRIENKEVPVTNLQKVLYPAAGFTKGDLIHYYIGVAPVLLPHLQDRALTMKRYPEGVRGFFFYEKNCPAHRPTWVKTAEVFSKRRGEPMAYCLANNLPSLVWMANLADLELHVSLARAKKQERPTTMVFDLDPGEGTNILHCARVGLAVRDKLRQIGLESFPKTSGSKGLQVYAPLNTAGVDFDQAKAASRLIAEAVEKERPGEVVTNMRKELRRGKVLIDWSQNDEHKTTVCVYSLRATEQPSVSTPLEWKEVETLLKRAKREAFYFGPDALLARVAKLGDLFEPVLTLKQKLGK